MTIKIKIERDGETFWECEVPPERPTNENKKLTKVIEALNELLIEKKPDADRAIRELLTGRPK